MAKEMMIAFVYDTELLKSEEDDPASAILYFHPGWVSDQQRTSLCGQIIGTWHFLTSVFCGPQIFALQSGKFSIRMYGRYVLALGSDRNIADWILEHRMSTLTALISFFHSDLEKMSEIHQDTGSFSGKLYHMFETYLKILMYGGHMFYNIPNLHLPKSASHVFLESIQLLQCCQQMNNVLGGVILYHNQVVATQLSAELTKRLVLTDPYRIKSPAETMPVDFSIPLGVQLLQVYISYQDYQLLQDDASKVRSTTQYFNKLRTKKTSSKSVPVREPILSAMKRDQSLIFTTVPEEDADHPSGLERAANAKSPDRPKFLNLKSKTTDAKPPEPRTVPSTPFLGQTSVCSTPMTELNKVVHPNIMSICVNPEEPAVRENLDNSGKNFASVERVLSVNGESEKAACACAARVCNPYDRKRSSSMWELRERLKSTNKRITMKYYSSRLLHNFEDEEAKVPKEKHFHLFAKEKYKTIGDPLHPIFKATGQAVSRHLYSKCLEESLAFDLSESAKPEEFKSAESFLFSPKKDKPSKSPKQVELAPKAKDTRKALTLPLKSLSEQSDSLFSPSARGRGVQLTPLMSKLSLLAMEEKSSGFCSRDTTPSEYKDPRFTPSQPNYSFLRRKSSAGEELKVKQGLRKAVLFVCGQQDMVMGMLLEELACCDAEVVNSLFEKCTESLGKLERQLHHCLETYPGANGQNESGEPYSYLCMDSRWDTVQRGGPWSNVDLGFLTHLHRDFININNVTEIILRNDDSIIYGNHCGNSEVFYQQVVSGTAGLPTPADPMGTVALKARRRLERDHAVILL